MSGRRVSIVRCYTRPGAPSVKTQYQYQRDDTPLTARREPATGSARTKDVDRITVAKTVPDGPRTVNAGLMMP